MSAKLSSDDRSFYELVSRAAFDNPFSETRDAVDRVIVDEDVPDLIASLTRKVAQRLDGLDLSKLNGTDRELAERAVLFHAFHVYCDDFDRLIDEQGSSDTPVKVDFADALTKTLQANRFPIARVGRVIELFYQMRRAWCFIGQGLTGTSRSMRRLRERLWNVVMTNDIGRYESHLWDRMEDFSTILTGETGTGKGAAAAAIGHSGFIGYDLSTQRFESRFLDALVPINLSEFPDTLLESALFGHVKGAFTGAVQKRDGALAKCSAHGTVFLDEIGEVAIPAQVKLLRVLQEREFTPLGSDQSRRFEGRVVAATHRSIDQLRKQKKFRDDFYYRLSSAIVDVPPLRVRLAEDPGELEVLIAAIVPRVVGGFASDLLDQVHGEISKFAFRHNWPGNVRELEQCVRRVLLIGDCPSPGEAPVDPATSLGERMVRGELTAAELLAEYCAHLYARHGTYERVARATGLDRRTVKKYVDSATPPKGD